MAQAQSWSPPLTSSISFTEGITMVVGSFAVGAVLQADITRYASSQKDAWLATLIGYLFANTGIILAGTMITMSTNTQNLPQGLLALGMGVGALLILVLGQWTTNDNNLYSSSLGFSSFIQLRKRYIVLICGTVATLAGYAGLATHFVPWLIALGVWIPPIAGILIVEYMLSSRSENTGKEESISMRAFVAWGVGAASGYWLPMGIPALTSLVVAAVAYGLCTRRFF